MLEVMLMLIFYFFMATDIVILYQRLSAFVN